MQNAQMQCFIYPAVIDIPWILSRTRSFAVSSSKDSRRDADISSLIRKKEGKE
jgi:hypothetical protein